MRVGIIALVDEATGYQKDRARDALAEIHEQFIAKELRPHIRMFPSEFYENLFRLRGLEFPRDSGKKPQYFGHLSNDIVWARLVPGVLEPTAGNYGCSGTLLGLRDWPLRRNGAARTIGGAPWATTIGRATGEQAKTDDPEQTPARKKKSD